MLRRFSTAFLVLASVLVAGIAGEISLRLAGGTPTRVLRPAHEPVFLEPDPERGWRNKPGRYVYPGYRSDAAPITVTVDASHRRVSAPEPISGDALWLVGCSFTFGWAVSDHDTFAWRLQERASRWSVANYGTAAYGTYQALLWLRAELANHQPALVVYGFHTDHARRNVAAPEWLRALQGGRQAVAIPYVAWHDERLHDYPPRRVPRVPGRTWFATSAAIENLLLRRWPDGRADGDKIATVRLVQAMDAAARARGARFVVALLDGAGAALDDYAREFAGAGIQVLDCRQHLGWALRVPGEGHPNATAHARWAECLSDALS